MSPASLLFRSVTPCKPCFVHRASPSLRSPKLSPRTIVRVSAKDDPDKPPTKTFSREDACKILGVGENASFDQIMEAKKSLLAKSGSDGERASDIEGAYDTMFMGAMQKRLGGSVSQQVRFADVPSQKPRKAPAPKFALPGGLSVNSPSKSDINTQVPIYATLAVWAIVQVLLEGQEAQVSDTAGLQIALALIYAGYTFKKTKGMDIGKSIGIPFVLLIVGTILGSGIENWLRVDIVPIGNFAAPGVLVSEFAIIAVALGSLFVI
eukprot:gene8173-1429_t